MKKENFTLKQETELDKLAKQLAGVIMSDRDCEFERYMEQLGSEF